MAPALAKLTSNSTHLESGTLTSEQVSWIGSINCVGALVGSLSFGYIITSLGCKRSILLTAIPSIVYWLLISYGNSYDSILTARFIGGWASGGMGSAIILYVSEIANDTYGNLVTKSVNKKCNYSILVVVEVDWRVFRTSSKILAYSLLICLEPLLITTVFHTFA